MLRNISSKPAFQKAWLSASLVIGALGILSGAIQATHGHAGSVAGILGGGIMVFIGYVGLRGLKRRLVHSV
jgi:hypothetical protein